MNNDNTPTSAAYTNYRVVLQKNGERQKKVCGVYDSAEEAHTTLVNCFKEDYICDQGIALIVDKEALQNEIANMVELYRETESTEAEIAELVENMSSWRTPCLMYYDGTSEALEPFDEMYDYNYDNYYVCIEKQTVEAFSNPDENFTLYAIAESDYLVEPTNPALESSWKFYRDSYDYSWCNVLAQGYMFKTLAEAQATLDDPDNNFTDKAIYGIKASDWERYFG